MWVCEIYFCMNQFQNKAFKSRSEKSSDVSFNFKGEIGCCCLPIITKIDRLANKNQ